MIELNVNLQNKKQTCLHYCFSNELDEDSDDNNEHDVEMSEASDKVEATKAQPATSETKESEPKAIEQVATSSKRTFEENSTFFGNNGSVPMIMWPKDRILFNRLELIIQMFDSNGEWPQKAMFMFPGMDSLNILV